MFTAITVKHTYSVPCAMITTFEEGQAALTPAVLHPGQIDDSRHDGFLWLLQASSLSTISHFSF